MAAMPYESMVPKVSYQVTAETRLADLDRCRMSVWCLVCGFGRMQFIGQLMARYGADAKVKALEPKFKCSRPGCGGRGRIEAEKLIGIYRPCGDDPWYQ